MIEQTDPEWILCLSHLKSKQRIMEVITEELTITGILVSVRMNKIKPEEWKRLLKKMGLALTPDNKLLEIL